MIYTILSSFFFSILAGKAVLSSNNLSPNILFQSIALFVFFKDRDKKRDVTRKKLSNTIGFVAKHSLGVYAMHVMVFTTLLDVFAKIGLNNALITITLNVLISFVVSLVASFVLSKLPFLKRVV